MKRNDVETRVPYGIVTLFIVKVCFHLPIQYPQWRTFNVLIYTYVLNIILHANILILVYLQLNILIVGVKWNLTKEKL